MRPTLGYVAVSSRSLSYFLGNNNDLVQSGVIGSSSSKQA